MTGLSMTRRMCGALPFLAALAVAACARTEAGAPDPSRIPRELRPMVRLEGRPDTAYDILDRMKHFHVPGVSVAVIDHGQVVWASGFGVKRFGGSDPVDTSTLFLAGSISKPVFSTGALALVEQGELSLDEDVNNFLTSWHLPESRFTAEKKVTLQKLLSHSAGLTVWGFPGYEVGKPLPTVPQVLDGEKPANTPAVRNDTFPGARWLYSGGGFTIAQLMTTDVTGEAFPELMHRLVLEPAGMIHSTYRNPPPASDSAFLATAHEELDTPGPGGHHVYPEMAAAGLWTTPSDLARWAISVAQAFNGKEGGPISPDMARRMLTPQVTVPSDFSGPGTASWGLGVALAGQGDSLHFGHGGRDFGFVAQVFMWPTQGRGIVIMTNGISGRLMNEIVRAFDAEYGLSTLPRTEKRVMAGSPTLDGLAGTYRYVSETDSFSIPVERRGDALALRPPGATDFQRLLAENDTTFLDVDNAAEYVFARRGGDPSGDATRLVIRVPSPAGDREFVLQRMEP